MALFPGFAGRNPGKMTPRSLKIISYKNGKVNNCFAKFVPQDNNVN
jgi:hypothetical protein